MNSVLTERICPFLSVNTKPSGERCMASAKSPWSVSNGLAPVISACRNRTRNWAPPSCRNTVTVRVTSCSVPTNFTRHTSIRPVAWAMRKSDCTSSWFCESKQSSKSLPTRRLEWSFSKPKAATLASVTFCETASTTMTGSLEVSNSMR